MKNLFFTLTVVFFLFFLNSAFSQKIVLPDYVNVCPGQEIEYTIQSSYYGNNQILTIENGVFIAPASSYLFSGDSTSIIMNVSSINKKVTIRWDNNNNNLGRIILNSAQTQDFNIIIVPAPAGSGLTDKNILVGTHSFNILLNSISEVTYNEQRSNNISRTNYNENVEFGIRYYTYSYSISGDQPGWIAYRTYNPQGTACGSLYSEWDTVIINRKLNPPTISGLGLICSNTVYSISSSNSPADTYTWTVTNGLKIYKNGQYITTYTGTETSVTIYKPSGAGTGNIKVKASATGYIDSDETVKQVWYGVPSPDEISYYNVGPYYPSQNQICLDFPNDGKALYNNPFAGVIEYEWDALDWTIIQHPMVELPQVAMEDVQISAPMYGYSVGNTVYFTIRAKNSCGWSEWKYPKLELQAVNCGMFMMTLSPNPADTYVNVSLSDANLTTEMQSDESSKKHKISFKKSKEADNEISEEYLVQILDKNGTVRKSLRSKSLSVNIDTNDLESGTYFLHLSFNKEVVKQQLIIK
ncbi:T9SS type A sorting domain-containing protein [Maribellus sp. CM-23]|uniref:T9SS type A sorting domain-containing protein n=1 Tax=Maribellus sp. CM-23 TaxID=2781026 RepID=UPI001F2784F2|nr:T9SS type A sorting domain-containing protein [Maribellus sp. CM-23]MCE4563216.1 T9SS type A sorting domain-containing protein [Maribellus sp. CM-23]